MAVVVTALLVIGVVIGGLVAGLSGSDDESGAGAGDRPDDMATTGATAGRAEIEGHARSVVASGTVRLLDSLHLRDAGPMRVHGRVVDADGRDMGTGLVEVDGPEIRAEGEQISLGVTFLRIPPDGPAVVDPGLLPDSRPGAGGSFTVHGGRVTLSAPAVTFTPDAPPDGDAGATPAPVALSSGVTVHSAGARLQVDYDAETFTWLDVPDGPITVATAWLTWAGSGTVTHDGQSYSHEYLGVRGGGEVVLERRGGEVLVSGDTEVAQIWRDGLAQVPTTGIVEIKYAPSSIPAGSSARFTWAPTNTGAYDMAMTSIRPDSEAGGWVELALDPLPKMFGGEDRAQRGGDTTGLIHDEGGFFDFATQPISSMIRPGTGDERDISVHVPDGTPPGTYTVVLVVEGNFEPIRVEIPVRVT